MINEGYYYDVVNFGGEAFVTINDEKYSLKEALNEELITRADIISQLYYDAVNKNCRDSYYLDGGSRTYRYSDYLVIVTNRMLSNKQEIVFASKKENINSYNDASDSRSKQSVLKRADGDYKESSFKYKDTPLMKIKEVYQGKPYSIYTCDGEIYVEINGEEVDLKEAIDSGNVSVSSVLKELERDANEGRCVVSYFLLEGKYRAYGYNNISIFISNKYADENPEIVFSKYVGFEDFLRMKNSEYSGNDYEEGIGVKAEVEK